jgi:ABC-type transport system substrate-binding protein
MRTRHVFSLLMLSVGAALLIAAAIVGVATSATQTTHVGALRGGVLRVAHSGGGFDTLDPQISYVTTDWAALRATQRLLLNFPNRVGKAGEVLQPDAAAAMPTVSKDGRTYTFRLRKGMRFSDGTRVTAAAFRRAFERVLSPQMYVQSGCFIGLDKMIVGAEKFADCAGYKKAKRPLHISGIKANDLTLIFHLTKANPTFLSILGMQWFGAVKPNMKYSNNPNGILTYPSAGPYYLKTNSPQHLAVLARNKYYDGAQEANPDEIVINENQGSGEAQVLQIEKGQLDYDMAGVPSDQIASVAQRYGVNKGQFHVTPTACVFWEALNNRRPPTNDVSVRRALNYAIGRTQILRLFGPYAGSATDQILVPGLVGYKKFTVYNNHPSVARAEAVGGSALQHAPPIDIYSSVASSNVGQLIQAQLQRIGLTVNLIPPPQGPVPVPYDRGYNMTPSGYCADYFDPFDFINLLFDSRMHGPYSSNVHFGEPSFDRKAEHAALLSGRARARAYAALDRLLMTKYAPVLPIEVVNARYLTSRRVHNVISSTYYGGPLLNAMSVG